MMSSRFDFVWAPSVFPSLGGKGGMPRLSGPGWGKDGVAI